MVLRALPAEPLTVARYLVVRAAWPSSPSSKSTSGRATTLLQRSRCKRVCDKFGGYRQDRRIPHRRCPTTGPGRGCEPVQIWLTRDSNAGTSVTFLSQLRERHYGPLKVIWDQRAGPPRRGGARVPGGAGPGHTTGEPAGLQPGLQRRQGDQGSVSEEATGNLCLGSKALAQERVGDFLSGLASRSDEVKRRCRTVLQSRAEGVLRDCQPNSRYTGNVHPTLAIVEDNHLP